MLDHQVQCGAHCVDLLSAVSSVPQFSSVCRLKSTPACVSVISYVSPGHVSSGITRMPADTFDMEQDNLAMQHTDSARRRPSQRAQFAAVLKKNFILQTRSRKAFFGIGGWTALLREVFVPVLFFLLMCIPKYYLPLSHSPRQLSTAYSLDSTGWAQPPYDGVFFRPQTCTHAASASH